MWQEIINNFISVTSVSIVIVYLSKILISNLFSKDLEKFKNNLEKEAFSYRVRYEKMHLRRAEAIEEIYRRMVKTYRAFRSYVHPMQSSKESQEAKGGEVAKIANDFSDYYEENRIFIDEDLAQKIDKLSDVFRKVWGEFETYRFGEKLKQPYFEGYKNAWETISKETPIIKKEIENEFRKIIGIKDEH
jgi:hypothetical protein